MPGNRAYNSIPTYLGCRYVGDLFSSICMSLSSFRLVYARTGHRSRRPNNQQNYIRRTGWIALNYALDCENPEHCIILIPFLCFYSRKYITLLGSLQLFIIHLHPETEVITQSPLITNGSLIPTTFKF